MNLRHALLCALLAVGTGGPARAVAAAADVERIAVRAARALDGVVRDCPASFARIGTDAKACVGVGAAVEDARVTLGAAFTGELYGVWRSRDGQRSVFNWVSTPGGFVYVRVQPDPDGRARTLVYVDVPPDAPGAGGGTQLGSVTLTPVPGTAPADAPAAAGAPTAATPGPSAPGPAPSMPAPAAPAPATPTPATPGPAAESAAPVPFRRTLAVSSPRMSGPDVLAVQNRLISLMRPARAGRGDGWFGPVTAAAVRAFQGANGLPVSGRVDRATWAALFADTARPFRPPAP